MIRIGLICSDMADATSFYRGIGPMARLRKEFRDIDIEVVMELNWYSIKGYDILFMQRPFNDAHMTAAQMAKTANLKLWLDYDDNLFAIPKDNPAHYIYEDPNTKQMLRTIAGMADVVTVSTPALASVFSAFNQNVRVVPNALDDEVCRRKHPAPIQSEKYILWRGNFTHERDVDSIHESLVSLSHEELFTDWKWFFFGMYPWRTMNKMKSGTAYYGKGTEILRYFNVLEAMQPQVMIVPLADIPLNHSKSNIAWIEGTWAGASVLAQDLPEWKRPGISNFSDQAGFEQSLRELVRTRNVGCAMHNEDSWYYILDCLTAKHTSKMRNDIVRELA